MSAIPSVEEPSTSADLLTAQGYPWLSLGRNAIEATNEIAGKRRTIHFKLLEDTFWFRFTVIAPPGAPVAQYTLKFGEDCVFISLHAPIPEGWMAPSFRGVACENLPDELQDIVLEAGVAPLLKLLGSLWGTPPHLFRGITPEAGTAELTALSWEAGRAEKEILLTGDFHLPSAALTKLLATLRPVKPEAGELWDRLLYPVSVETGSTTLPWRELRSVQNNDVILLDDGFPLDKPECLVLIGDQKISAKRTGDQVTTSGRLAPISSMANASAPSKAEAAPSPTSAEDLPVRLSFTVGDAELPFRELKNLQEGYTFVLNRPVTAPVQIRAQGAIVGTGELVMVGDQVGVRVIELHLGA